MVTVIAMEVLPEERDRKYYADNYSCCPPPLFIIFITLVEVSCLPLFIHPPTKCIQNDSCRIWYCNPNAQARALAWNDACL